MAKTTGVASANELIALLEKSGLLEEAPLAEVKSLAAENPDPRALARQLVTRSLATRWQAGQLLKGSSKLQYGKYRLLDQIGVGRIGREFLAEHQHLGRRVAIKLVSSALTGDANRLKQFLAESRRAVSLDHPHLVHSYDVDQEGQRYYVVTEFVEGEDLGRHVKRAGPRSQAEAIELLTQAAEGLRHAAAAEVLHGDLKPSNLIVDKQGVLKVVDLGFARLVDGAPNTTPSRDSQDQNLNDGIEYCAPEALNGVEGDMDARSDMFSLGQTLFFLLTGSSPGAPANTLEEQSASLVAKLPKASKEVTRLYARLTAVKLEERPTSWDEVLSQLREVSAALVKSEPQPAAAVAPPVKRKPPVATPLTASEATAAKDDSSPAIVIDTGGSGSRPATTAAAPVITTTKATQAAAATAEQPAASPAPKPARGKSKKIDKRVALGIAIGAGVLMLLVSVGVLMALLGGGGGDDVAQTPGKDASAQNKTEQPPEEATNEAELNPTEANPEPPPTVTETNPEPPLDTAVASATNPAPAAATATETVAPVEPKNEPKPEPEAPKTAPDAAPKPEPAPEPKAEPKPEPKAEPKPEPKPEPAKTAPPANPLEKLPAVVELPEIPSEGAASAPLPLGEIHIPSEALMFVSLQGGDTASRNRQKFTLANAGGGSDPRNWEVSLSGKPGDPSIVVAKLGLKENQFSFQWTPEAAAQPTSVQLSNCLLQLTAGKDARDIALRKPVEIEPLTVDLEKGVTAKFPLTNAPPADYMRVEFVGLDPAMFPNPEFKPEASISADKGTTFLWFGETPEGRNLGLKLTATDKSKSLEVDLQPVFRIDAQSKEERITKRTMPHWKGFVETKLQALTVGSAAIDASKLEKDQKDQRKNLIAAEQKKYQGALENLNKAYELHQKVHNQAVMHIRITYDTGGGKVLLAQTTGAPDEAPPKPKPAEKKK